MQPILSQLPMDRLSSSQRGAGCRLLRPTQTIGVIIPEVETPFFVRAIDGIEAVARQHNYYVVICLTYGEESRQATSMRLLANGRVDGVLLHNMAMTSTEMQGGGLMAGKLPLVFFDFNAEHYCGTAPTIGAGIGNSLLPPSDSTCPLAYTIGKEAAEMLFQAMQQGESL